MGRASIYKPGVRREMYTSNPSCTTKNVAFALSSRVGLTSWKSKSRRSRGQTLLISRRARFRPMQTWAPPPNYVLSLAG
jgi:hypothetical protein